MTECGSEQSRREREREEEKEGVDCAPDGVDAIIDGEET